MLVNCPPNLPVKHGAGACPGQILFLIPGGSRRHGGIMRSGQSKGIKILIIAAAGDATSCS